MRVLLSFLAFLLIPLSAWPQKYKNPTGKQFPIIAWYALDQDHNKRQDYEMLADAGFNLSLSFFSSYRDVLLGLESCAGTGVKLITYCWEQRNKAEFFIPLVRNNSNLALYYVSDEPTQEDFNNVFNRIKAIKSFDKKHICYVNLQPNYASPTQLKSESYSDYIENYINAFEPSMISFDFYPFRYNGFREGYYENLSYISNVCKERGIPFWGFIMSATDAQYPQTNEAYLRFQAAMNLAYGAKGIQYFTYSIPSDNYKSAIVDKEFKKTDTYDIVKKLNKEILHYSKIWLNSKVNKVWYVGSKPPQGLETDYCPKKLNKLSCSGKGFVVSHFISKGRQYIIAINFDVENNQELIVEGKRRLKLCNVEDNAYFKKQTLDVNPGDYILIRL